MLTTQEVEHPIGRKRYDPTPEHRAIVAAMGDKSMDDNAAMAMLHEYETMKQRLN